jgi:hypothetical protein
MTEKNEPETDKVDHKHPSRLMVFAKHMEVNRILASASYGTENDFIRDGLEQCLKNNIIPKKIAYDDVFRDYKKSNHTHMYLDPHRKLTYNGITSIDYRQWQFKFVKIELPDNMHLKKGCPCHSNFDPGVFSLYKDNEIMKTFSCHGKLSC